MAFCRSDKEIESATLKLLAHCRAENWAGYDPYDALNSHWLRDLPLLDSKLPRLILTQTLKRSPVNLRPLLRIPKTQNPKALGLFVSALVRLNKAGMISAEADIAYLVERLTMLRSPEVDYWRWGYSFPWQSRFLLAPSGEANLVCSVFVAQALLDAYEHSGDARLLRMADSAANYLVSELYWSEGSTASFSYPTPEARSRVHNANFLAAALLCRLAALTGAEKFIQPALNSARYSASKQRADGSWPYGEEPSQQWIDNFHTGYNLCALRAVAKSLGTDEFDACIEKGFRFYQSHFFREDGAPKYFHNRVYPIDIHCAAQSILTLLEFSDLYPESVTKASMVLRWTLDHMWDERGFFYYRVLRTCTIKTSYMRWSQAWMLTALTALLLKSNEPAEIPFIAASALSR